MFNISYLALAAFGSALVVTLVMAAYLTPAHWWRQMNLRAAAIVVLGTWGIGSLILWMVQAAGPASGMEMAKARAPVTGGVAPLSAAPLHAAADYRVYDDLNIRAGKGTAAARVAVVPAGAVVTTTGVREGDWWQVRARVKGKDVQGWASSLWLRRADERLR